MLEGPSQTLHSVGQYSINKSGIIAYITHLDNPEPRGQKNNCARCTACKFPSILSIHNVMSYNNNESNKNKQAKTGSASSHTGHRRIMYATTVMYTMYIIVMTGQLHVCTHEFKVSELSNSNCISYVSLIGLWTKYATFDYFVYA